MSYYGFGGHSGPTAPPRASTAFGQSPRPPSPSPPQLLQSLPQVPNFPRPVPVRSPPKPEGLDRAKSPLFFPQSNFSASSAPFSAPAVQRLNVSFQGAVEGQKPPYKDKVPQANQRSPSTTSLVATRNSGTGVTAKIARLPEPRSNLPLLSMQRDSTSHFAPQPRSPLSYEDIYDSKEPYKSPVEAQGSTSIPRPVRSPPLALRSNYSPQEFPYSGKAQRPAAISASGSSRTMSQGNYTYSAAHHVMSPSPPYIRPYDSRRGPGNVHLDVGVSGRIRSPVLPSTSELSPESLQFGQFDPERSISSPLSSSAKLESRPQPSISNKAMSSLPNVVPKAPEANSTSFLAPKRMRPSSALSSDQDYQSHQNGSPSFLSGTAEAPATNPIGSPISKRTRSPSSPLTGQELQQHSQSSHDEIEREMQAKAKRLARFKVELIESPQSGSEFPDAKLSSVRCSLSVAGMDNLSGRAPTEVTEDYPSSDPLENYDASEPSSIIIGFCPDMCPESERAERERKGDLDQYERVDGDRNRTSEFLAVKKYNRTAEREANLIRPMPVLQRTTNYLLGLLDQPYDDRFIGIYNFLWDRMRAIRMDLRMQHIFNLESVKMLEQMIRLHIIAMHELCEYEKGEGFSEGFDAHLNIEQMNKTSAELFQLYDDHRRKGINVATEREFRGYYALLKLDRHPGYKVEPAELSLDLAKMTPEIRQTSEIRFAQDVARACRTGNFISFFRLARKASYLQACLMHAHFAKLRSQALASLHSSLQNNQGLPVSVIASWLAMEEEDIESVLHYHGFLIKEFEEPYMVKEGPFLNSDKDYHTKCSDLVHLKKSSRIVDDVLSLRSLSSPFKKETEVQLVRNSSVQSKRVLPSRKRSQMEEDEKLDGSEAIQLSKLSDQDYLPFKSPAMSQEKGSGRTMALSGDSSWNFPMTPISPKVLPVNFVRKFESNDNLRYSINFPTTPSLPKAPPFDLMENFSSDTSSPDISIPSAMEVMLPPVAPAMVSQDGYPTVFNNPFENSLAKVEAISHLENEEPHTYQDSEADLEMYQEDAPEEDVLDNEDKEVAEAKLKLILRAWKRRSSKRRELREQRQLVAADALNSLTLGPPIQWKNDRGGSFGNFDIDRITMERFGKHEQSWSRLNIADVTAATLIERNPKAKCLCWKIILLSPMPGPDSETNNLTGRGTHLTASDWLRAKLMPCKDEDYHDELILSHPGLSIWKKWLGPRSRMHLTCCLSVVKEISCGNDLDDLWGASAVLFLLSEGIPLEHQKIRLQNLLNALPPGSQLPLLILSDVSSREAPSAIISSLGLHEIEPSRAGNFRVVFLTVDEQVELLDGFFSDRQLREGLQWLARESPPQPVLLNVQTRGLVQSHLSSSLDKLGQSGAAMDLIQYVTAFNEAVDQSISKVITAASFDSSGWPCPEILLLTEFCDEGRFAEQYLPTIRWSLDSNVKPLLSALGDCKLPNFADDISWLKRGCYIGEEIERQKLLLQNLLVRYLTESTNIMGISLARHEASVMVQRNVRLELRGSAYFIIPAWELIFRRIFNWRLMNLSRQELSTCYILEQDAVCLQPLDVSKLADGEGIPLDHSLESPSLDEMLQVSRILQCSVEYDVRPKVLEPGSRSTSYGVQLREDNIEIDGHVQNNEMAPRIESIDYTSGDDALRSRSSSLAVSAEVTKQTDKLSSLLQKCNMLQDVIDQKLSVYF